MAIAAKPFDEEARLRALIDMRVLDTDPEPALDKIVQAVVAATGSPVSLISLVDSDRQWFKARVGIDVSETSRDDAFCAHAILESGPLVISDAGADPRFSTNPLVTGAPHIRSYLGVPLTTVDGHRPGTLCAIDTRAREWTTGQIQQVEILAELASELLRQRASLLDLEMLRSQERKLKNQILQNSELFDEVSKVAKIGGWRLNLDTMELHWTDETRRIHEVADDFSPDLETAVAFYAPEAQALIQASVDRAMETGESWDQELPLVTAKSKPIWVRAMGSLHEGPAGTRYLSGAFQEITAERERADQLKAAVDRAEEAARTKSEFLANMSHEIRTPLNGVLGIAQAMAHESLSAEQATKVKMIIESGKSLLSILNDILDYSKMEAGKLHIDAIPGDIRGVIEIARQLFAPLANDKGLKLVVRCDEDVPPLLQFDPVRIGQCVNNLLSNAIKFTESGGVGVRVRLDRKKCGTQLVCVEVADTGIGMSPQHLAKLFNAFAQADGSISRRYGGTGLGLTISASIARLLGGDLVAQSVEGEGSLFRLTFEATEVEQSSKETNRPSQMPQNVPRLPLRSVRLLLVDDNAMNRTVIRMFLAPHGVEIVEAQNGREAIDRLERQDFDIVLLDGHMPVMDGRATIKHIRSVAAYWKSIPVIALTADAMAGDREKYLAIGMTDYIAKPIDERELLSKLMSVLGFDLRQSAKPELSSVDIR